jgi:hypothetical protein
MFFSHFADLALMTVAYLKAEFFENLRPTIEFFQKWKEFESWSPDCLPVYEWEDLLYVAISHENPPSPNPKPNVIYCKTDPEILKQLWAEWASDIEQPQSLGSQDGAPEGFLMDLPVQKAKPLSSEEVSIESLFEATVAIDPGANTPPIASAPMATPPVASAASSEFDFEKYFKELNYHYEKSILFLASDSEAKALKWSSKVHPSPQAQESSYSLQVPSFLRIAAKTGKAYHGYVVESEFAEKFFEDWNESKIPDHLTVSPVEIEGQVVGLLVSMGEKSADTTLALQLAEKVSSDLSQVFTHHPSIFKGMAA